MKRVIIASTSDIKHRMQWDIGGRTYSIIRMKPETNSCVVKIRWEQDGRGLTKHLEFGIGQDTNGQYIYSLDNPDLRLYAADATDEEYYYKPTAQEDDDFEDEEEYTPRMGYDYSPSAPWGALGMSERDFI